MKRERVGQDELFGDRVHLATYRDPGQAPEVIAHYLAHPDEREAIAAAGAHGELVSDPEALEAAIARCLAAVRGGKSAVLHARVIKL